MTSAIDILLHALHGDPTDEAAWLALADALEEAGQLDRAELTRLTRQLRNAQLDTEVRRTAEQRVADLLQAGVSPCVPLLTNSIGMTFALLPAGTFVMGSPETEADRSDDEGPQHTVEITRPFYLGVYPVTQRQWQNVMGDNPSCFSAQGGGKGAVAGLDTSDFPVERVSWEDAAAFLEKLSMQTEEN